MTVLHKATYRFNVIAIKLPMAFFTELEQNFCNLYGNPRPQIFKAIFFFFYFFPFIFISWRLITLQYCSGFLPYINMNQPWIYMCSPSWICPLISLRNQSIWFQSILQSYNNWYSLVMVQKQKYILVGQDRKSRCKYMHLLQ